MREVITIACAGGPGSGKSTMWKMLRDMLGDVLVCVPEVATMLIAEWRQKRGVEPPFEGALLHEFQLEVLRLYRVREQVAREEAVREKKPAILFDRFTIDAPAYLPGGEREFTELTGTTVHEEYLHLDYVFFFDMPTREIYEVIQGENPTRCEPWEVAKPLSERTWNLWSRHPGVTRIPHMATAALRRRHTYNAMLAMLLASTSVRF